jgi:hypothetical protein
MKQNKGLLFVLLLCAAIGLADEKAKPAIIPVPEVDQLTWSNLRLQAANLRLQADALDAKANDKLVEIKKQAGADETYDFQFSSDGKMQLARRPDPKPKETIK